MEKYYTQFIILLLVLILFVLYYTKSFNRHKYNQRISKNILLKINSFQYEGQKINYLRKINPFVFEELLLDAFLQKGYTIKRNKRYTNDGGIDGIVFKDDIKYLIQAKRYKSYVNNADLISFIELTKKHNCRGFFCHTGKTGKNGKTLYNQTDSVEIYSGSKLLLLINEINEKKIINT